MGFSGQGYWSGLPFPAPGDLPDPGIEPRSPALQADSLCTELRGFWLNCAVRAKLLQLWQVLCDPMDCIACQVLPSMEFSRQECWSGLAFPSPGDLPDPGIESASPALTGGFFTTVPSGNPHNSQKFQVFASFLCAWSKTEYRYWSENGI